MPEWMTEPWVLGAAVAVLVLLVVVAVLLLRARRKPGRPRAPRPSERIVGKTGTVIQVVRAHGWTGLVRVGEGDGAEEWRAESEGPVEIPEGTSVEIVRVVGTHVVVRAREG